MMKFGYALIFAGFFLEFGNMSGYFTTFSNAGFFTISAGGILLVIGWVLNQSKAIKSYTEINGDPVLKSGFSHIKHKKGEIRGALFLTKGGIYFKSNPGEDDVSLPAHSISDVSAARIGPVKNRLNVTLHDETLHSFIVTGAVKWAAAAEALEKEKENKHTDHSPDQ